MTKLEKGKIEFDDPNFKPREEPVWQDYPDDFLKKMLGLDNPEYVKQLNDSYNPDPQNILKFNKLLSQIHTFLSKLDELFDAELEQLAIQLELKDTNIQMLTRAHIIGVKDSKELVKRAFEDAFKDK